MAANPQTVTHLPSFSAHVTFTVALKDAETFLRFAKSAYDAIITEPDCVFFEIFQHPDNPGEFKFIETWTSNMGKTLAVSKQSSQECLVEYGAILI